jgi:2-methylcitrate dehydratase PrpD
MALADGELTSAQFKSGRWQAPDVKALMAMMTCVPSADLEARFPNGRPARLTAQMKDGTQQSILVEAPLGDSSRPMSERQLLDKFLAQTTAVIGADRAMQAAETILNLEKLDNIGSLTALLIAPR